MIFTVHLKCSKCIFELVLKDLQLGKRTSILISILKIRNGHTSVIVIGQISSAVQEGSVVKISSQMCHLLHQMKLKYMNTIMSIQ